MENESDDPSTWRNCYGQKEESSSKKWDGCAHSPPEIGKQCDGSINTWHQ